MANWARVRYHIEGRQENLQEIYNLYQTHHEEGDDTLIWESEIIEELGIDCKDSSLRGYLLKCEFSDETLCVEAEEAWMLTDFRHLLESNYSDMTIYYMIEEPGCEVYITNDADGKYFPTRIVVDVYINDVEEHKEFKHKEEALYHVAQTLRCDTITVEDIDKWNKEHKDDYIGFHEYEIMPCILKRQNSSEKPEDMNTENTTDSDKLIAAYMKAVEDGDDIAMIIYGRLIALS